MYKASSVREEKRALRRKFATARQEMSQSEKIEKSRDI